MDKLISCVLKESVLPILIALVTYLVVNRLGEWKDRQNNCKLGVAIIDSLLEEIRTGLCLMTSAFEQAQQPMSSPPSMLVPVASWSGMTTLPNEVLLRVIAVSQGLPNCHFHPSRIRSHCKNYFDHMCTTYNEQVKHVGTNPDWRVEFLPLLGDEHGKGPYLMATQSVIKLLEQTKELLNTNSKKWFPK